MMANFLSPKQVEQRYFQILKSLKPSLNINDANSDFVIRGKATSGLASGLYGDLQKINNDTFISTARIEALLLIGKDLNIDRQPETVSKTIDMLVTGTPGTIVGVSDLTFLYSPTNVLYSNTTGGTIDGSGNLHVQVQALVAGQKGNVAAPDTFQVVSPPSGVNSSASLVEDMADGGDIESVDSYRSRLLARRQQPPSGGNSFDYPNFAFDADPSVRSVFIKRFGRGLGTVDVYITTGTTDIDSAVTNGQAIIRIPGAGVIATVQQYYDDYVPLTDCPKVYAPVEVIVPVTAKVVLAAGLTASSVPSDPVYNPLNLTCAQLIEREIQRALYKLPVGGRTIPGFTNGFVPVSDIEEALDFWLSAVKDSSSGIAIGRIPILSDRQVQNLDSPNVNLELLQNELASPGVITIQYGV